MMNRHHLFIPAFLSAIFLASCSGLYLQSGKTAYEEQKYMEAARLLEKGLSGKEDPEARRMLAESNMLLGNYGKSAEAYSSANTDGSFNDDDRISYGKALMAAGNYPMALEIFEGILSRQPGHPVATSLARACRNTEEMKRDSALYKVSPMGISGLETAFSPAKTKDGFIVSGEKAATGPKDPYTGYTYTDLYFVKSNGTGFDAPVRLDNLNSRYHEGVATVSSDGKTMYISRSYFEGKKLSKDAESENNLGIWYSNMNGESSWNVPALLPSPFNDINYNYLHPALSTDGKTMYFASDMPGGYGGMDLYKSTLEATNWSKPVNLGANVNTSGDEAFPYLKSSDTLYFSSDAHFGLGGKDIMYSVSRGGTWSEPYHLGYPINTGADDFGVHFEPNGKKGLLSSNRDGNDRIYSFEIFKPVFNINGLVSTKKSMLPLGGAKVTVTNITDGTEEVLYTDENGEFKYPLLPGKNYRVKIDEDGHFSQTKEISTIGKTNSQDFSSIFEMEELIVSDPNTVENGGDPGEQKGTQGDGTYVVPNIYWDYNKWFIREDAKPFLDDLVKRFKDNPNLKVELRSHCDCRGSDAFNDDLSQKRANAVVEYLVAKGVNRSMFISKGYGERKLVNRCKDGVECSEEEHQQNRRTEFLVLKK